MSNQCQHFTLDNGKQYQCHWEEGHEEHHSYTDGKTFYKVWDENEEIRQTIHNFDIKLHKLIKNHLNNLPVKYNGISWSAKRAEDGHDWDVHVTFMTDDEPSASDDMMECGPFSEKPHWEDFNRITDNE